MGETLKKLLTTHPKLDELEKGQIVFHWFMDNISNKKILPEIFFYLEDLIKNLSIEKKEVYYKLIGPKLCSNIKKRIEQELKRTGSTLGHVFWNLHPDTETDSMEEAMEELFPDSRELAIGLFIYFSNDWTYCFK